MRQEVESCVGSTVSFDQLVCMSSSTAVGSDLAVNGTDESPYIIAETHSNLPCSVFL